MRASRENAKPTLLRRALACLVSAAMVVAFTPVVAWSAEANTVHYQDASGTTKYCATATVVENSSSKVTWGANGETTWYVVQGSNVEISGLVTVNGNVHLILADGCELNVTIIHVPADNSLTIYGQQNGTGILTATASASGWAGICTDTYTGSGGSVTVNGGNIAAVGNGYGAGIGGGYFSATSGHGGTITINGGKVEATGGISIGAGIGAGGSGKAGTLRINGGEVTATGGSGGAGISSGSVCINGDKTKVEATGNGGGAGIGGRDSGGAGSTVTISGGMVTANGGSGGAGIGGGSFGSGGQVTITGGTVEATGSSGGADIGGGDVGSGSAPVSSGGTLIHIGGTVRAIDNATAGIKPETNVSSLTSFGDLTLPVDLTIPSGKTLTIPEGKTLTIPEGKTLTNEGTITNNGTLNNAGSIYVDGALSGTVSGSGAVCYPLTLVDADSKYSATGDISTPEHGKTYGMAGGTVTLSAREGYSVSWDVKDKDSTPITVDSSNTFTMPSAAIIVTAHWKAKTYEVTLNANGGTINSGNVTSYTYGQGATLPTDVTKTGYTFAGWYDGNSKVETIASGTTGAKSLVAQWTVNQYTIAFNTNGGSEVASITQDYGTDVTAPAEPTKTGYTFDGWDKALPATMPAENMTITAKWKINQYTITFDTGGGSAFSPITQDYGTPVTAPANPTKTGYTFAGWYKDSGLANAWNFTTDTVPVNGITLYAKWTVNQYTITYELDGGSNDDGNPDTYTVVSNTITLKPGKRSGYTFLGWYDGETKVEEIATGSVGNRELTAKWQAIYVPPSYNVPASGEGWVAVKVTVSGSTAVVAEIGASALEGAVGSGAATVTIDLSGLPKGVTQAQLSKTTVDKLLAVVSDEDNAVESVTVNLGGAVLVIDAKALAAVAEQVKGANVTLGVKESSADSLNSAQQKALSPIEVVQLYFTAEIKSGGAEIHDFGGGSVRVSVAFEPRAGHNPARYVVLYVGEDGAIERYGCAWANGMLSFTAPHFSTYAVVYVEDATQAAIDALEALPQASKLKTSQAKEAVKKAEDALEAFAALDGGQRMLVDEALVANAESVVKRGNELVAKADEKAVGKVKDKAFSVKAGKSKSIAFKTKMSAAGTKVVYKKTKGSKYITVTKAGKVTAKKGMRAGKKYTTKVKVTCGATTSYVKITVRTR